MGGPPPQLRDEAQGVGKVHAHRFGGRQIPRGDNAILRQAAQLHPGHPRGVLQDTAAHVPNVRRPLLEVGVAQLGEQGRDLLNSLRDGVGRVVPLLGDLILYGLLQHRVLQHGEVGGKNLRLLLPQPPCGLSGQRLDLLPRRRQGARKTPQLRLHLVRPDLRRVGRDVHRTQDHRPGDGDAVGNRDALIFKSHGGSLIHPSWR